MFNLQTTGIASALRAITLAGGATISRLKVRYEQMAHCDELRRDQKTLNFFGGEPKLPLPQALAEAVRAAKESVALISCTVGRNDALNMSRGTGFVVGTDGLLLTARHVIADKQSVTVILNKNFYRVLLLREAPERDLALLKLIPLTPQQNSPQFKSLHLSEEELLPGQLAAALGFPDEPKYQVSSGEFLGDFEVAPQLVEPGDLIEGKLFDLPWYQGGSGGPLITESGVVAIACAVELTGEKRLMAASLADMRSILAANSDKEGVEIPWMEI